MGQNTQPGYITPITRHISPTTHKYKLTQTQPGMAPLRVEMHKRSVRARSRPGQKNPDFFITRSGRVFLKIGPDRAGLFQKYQAWFSYKKPGFFKNPDFIRIFLKILGLFQALGPGRARPGFFRIGFFRFFSRSDRIGFRISDFLNISNHNTLQSVVI